jgi:transcriptional regulator with XRE-family HTH domain
MVSTTDKTPMPSRARTYSSLTLQALSLLGKQVRLARKRRRMTEAELAARIGIARGTLRLIEKGDPKVEIGLAFEAAAIAGVGLFTPEASSLSALSERLDDKLALLPRSTRHPRKDIDDAF